MADLGRIIDMLDRDGALHLDGQSDFGDLPRVDGDLYPVDFERLARIDDDGQFDQWFPEVDPEVLDGVLSGNGGLRGASGAVPAVDVLAWYQPIHFFANDWGIFIKEKALLDLAADLAPWIPGRYRSSSPRTEFASLIRTAFAFLFLHEQYHHKVESFSIRLHVVEQRLVYPDYISKVVGAVAGSDNNLEEALANADAWRRLTTPPYKNWVRTGRRQSVRNWMEDLFHHSPPGYRRAPGLLSPASFDLTEQLLQSRAQEARLSPVRTSPSDFADADHMMQSLFNLRQNIWTVVPTGSRPILPTAGVFPAIARTRLQKFLRRNGWDEVVGAGKGSHSKYRRDGKMIVVPHSRDVSRTVESSTARTLGVSVHDLRQLVG
jgi:predicted RNA binding protein YcfA (HicA-like mRNA interferase family)